LWEEVGCTAQRAGDSYIVHAREWVPAWLDPAAQDAVVAAVREQRRRTDRRVAADPVVELVAHLPSYVTPGQRAAVRSVFLTPPASTIIVNLPTGAGKTLAFQVPALVAKQTGGLVVVIVPTVALAKDQEARFNEMLDAGGSFRDVGPLAFHGGLDETSRTDMIRRLREGSQPILFTSPEAVTGVLRRGLFDVARRGGLRLFAVDEAHLVAHWGQQFRPEFQTLAGLREALLDACPAGVSFRTLLLSGTLTIESFSTLQGLFGQRGCEVVAESFLRTEPAFLIRTEPTDVARVDRVVEAMNHLPRPVILYTTRPEDAEAWFQRLRNREFRRVGMMRGGDATDAEGERILQRWRRREIDVMVATSAFGLGMDQDEVRSVVHACIPETLDRFYQEVGRGGRDGRACVSLLVTSPRDRQIAEKLASKRVISVDRGYERWRAMWLRHAPVGDGVYRLSLDDRPLDLLDASDESASWNLRTLVLMARAGLIEFAAEDPNATVAGDKSAPEARWRHVAVRVNDHAHSEKSHWEAVVAAVRNQLKADDRRGVEQLRELVRLQRPLNDVFREIYSIADAGIFPPRLHGNCPVTRARGSVGTSLTEPEVRLPAHSAATVSPTFLTALRAAHDGQSRYLIAYTPPATARLRRESEQDLVAFAMRAARAGVVEFAAPPDLLRTHWEALVAQCPLGFPIIAEPQPSLDAWDVARLSIVSPATPLEQWVDSFRLSRPVHVLVLPDSLPDPTHPERRFFDVRPSLTVTEALRRLEL
jgi:superfamily II DNA/RNA helicase